MQSWNFKKWLKLTLILNLRIGKRSIGSEEEDYSADQKEAYFEEKSNEYSSYHISREDAEYDSSTENSTTKDEDFSVPHFNLFYD